MAWLNSGVARGTKLLAKIATAAMVVVTLASVMDSAVACRPGMDPTGEQCGRP